MRRTFAGVGSRRSLFVGQVRQPLGAGITRSARRPPNERSNGMSVMGPWQEFKEPGLKGNPLSLAIGAIIGAASARSFMFVFVRIDSDSAFRRGIQERANGVARLLERRQLQHLPDD
jgi:hypothetical protein